MTLRMHLSSPYNSPKTRQNNPKNIQSSTSPPHYRHNQPPTCQGGHQNQNHNRHPNNCHQYRGRNHRILNQNHQPNPWQQSQWLQFGSIGSGRTNSNGPLHLLLTHLKTRLGLFHQKAPIITPKDMESLDQAFPIRPTLLLDSNP